MAGELKAIETVWNGYKFRSRLEARWAVFLDAIGVQYDYEPEGFDLDGLWYLPDFWLPSQNCWAEIKPMTGSMSLTTWQKAQRLSLHGRCNAVIWFGNPFVENCKAQYNGLLFNDGEEIGWKWTWIDCLVCHTVSLSNEYAPGGYRCKQCSDHPPSSTVCQSVGVSFDGSWILYGPNQSSWHTPRLNAAYLKARQARFERGA